MKIGIITFHASFNYGSMLQAWALQTFLQKAGHVVEIINYRSKRQKTMYHYPLSLYPLRLLLRTCKRLFVAPQNIIPLCDKWHLFDSFLNNQMNLTKEYNTEQSLYNAQFEYDVIITGGDQIWNVGAYDFSTAYFADFVSPEVKRIAYSPSLGPNPEKLDKLILKKYIPKYDAISLRELRAKSYLEEIGIAKDIRLVLDPTMLLHKDDYMSFVGSEPLIKDKYLYYYTPGYRSEFIDHALNIAEKHNLKFVIDYPLPSQKRKKYPSVEVVLRTGPAEFLNLIYYSEIVCGASFHLMVFSILFEKNFYCINGDIDSRMNNLMNIAGLTRRIVSVNDFPDEYDSSDIDYKEVKMNLMEIRKQSEEFLLSSIG